MHELKVLRSYIQLGIMVFLMFIIYGEREIFKSINHREHEYCERANDEPDVVACICNPAKRRLNGRTVRVRIPSGERLLSRWVPIFKRSRDIDPRCHDLTNTQKHLKNQYIFRYPSRYIKNPKQDTHEKYEKSIPIIDSQ